MNSNRFFQIVCIVIAIVSCGGNKQGNNASDPEATIVVPEFSADSAYSFCEQQCLFGPRTMNSDAHDRCADWIMATFRSFGMTVEAQQADLKGYDGTVLHSNNIIASYKPEKSDRILLCAHWDSRPWADNDPDESNWHKPVMAANDGASGVAVMLEVARLLSQNELTTDLGVDFLCFDAEDWGTPQWAESKLGDNSDTWALGAQYWAAHPHRDGYKARFGILLDMVGGRGAHFYQELYSKHYAPSIVNRVWKAAETAGYGSFFPRLEGGAITDDHVPVNQVAGIPCIDIIPYYPDCEASSFGPTWHTVLDDMNHIDRSTLRAVGQTMLQVIYTEK